MLELCGCLFDLPLDRGEVLWPKTVSKYSNSIETLCQLQNEVPWSNFQNTHENLCLRMLAMLARKRLSYHMRVKSRLVCPILCHIYREKVIFRHLACVF